MILPLTLSKHPCQSEADKHFLFDNIPQSIHKIKFECIDAEVIRNTALCTRGGSKVSGMDPMAGGEYSHTTVLVRVLPKYV